MADLQLHTLLLCDYALTAQDGKISAIGVFSQINVGRLPATHGRCFIVAILEASPGPHELTLQVMSPSGKPTIQQAPRLRIEEIGRHRIEVRAGDALLGSAPFNVNLVMRQQPGNA